MKKDMGYDYQEIAMFIVKMKKFSGTVPLRLVYRMDAFTANSFYARLVKDGIIGKVKGTNLMMPLMSSQELERFFELRERKRISFSKLSKREKFILVNATMQNLGFEKVEEDALFDFVAYKDGKKSGIQLAEDDIYTPLSLLLKHQIAEVDEVILLSSALQESVVKLANHINVKCCHANGEFVTGTNSIISEELREKAMQMLVKVAEEKDILNNLFAENGLLVHADAVCVNEKRRKYLLTIDKEKIVEALCIVKNSQDLIKGNTKIIMEKKKYYLLIEDA